MDKYLNQKEEAKRIAKILRKYGLRCGVIRGNGSTSPSNGDKYPLYFTIEPKSRLDTYDYNRDEITLNYIFELAPEIEKALKENKISYEWDGSTSSCFVFQILSNKI